jgi:hypothetical protein
VKEVHYPVWRAIGIAALLVLAPTILGLVAAIVSGEHGSIIFLIFGLMAGGVLAASFLLLFIVRRLTTKRNSPNHA